MKKLEFCQNTFDIDPHGILIWSKFNTAIVSDLHLEKGSSYAKYGQYIPPYDSLETLINLETACPAVVDPVCGCDGNICC